MRERDHLVARAREEALLAPGRPVLVLLSGGQDSTCLLDLALRVSGAGAVHALHVNYGRRGAASDEDERHCAELCTRLRVALEVRRAGSQPDGNVQAWAREIRYREARALAAGADIATGHTATDQVETVLYRLASSPSRRALIGMQARVGSVIRPLLTSTREETAAYCRARGLSWREDASNASDAYARNRIRNELVPAMRSIHPAAEQNVLAVAGILRDEAEVLDGLVDEVLERGVSLDALRGLPEALRRLVVQRLADDAAEGFAPGVGTRADEVAALSDRGTAMLDIGSGLRAVAEYGRLRIEPLGAHARTDAPPSVALAIPGSASFGGVEVRCELVEPALEPGVLDRAALGSSELLVRSWRPGDRIAPVGLKGTKSLQDLFTARRVPRLERASVPVVESGGEIVWVAGLATSERFKVTAATTKAVRLSCRG
ncbi:MAG TPA: tRNA lysidine(34) synthetase TilS [Solirubrobacteraceae bacterium]|nr:tRNA lysidine(34) synthetase TilS [Solirubrobacteraceae bacterium]